MARVPKPFRFVSKMISDLYIKTESGANHTIRMGGTGRGKFYHWAWSTEMGMTLGKVKAYGVWCKDFSHLC